MLMALPDLSVRVLHEPDVVAQGFGHLLDPVQTQQQGHGEHHLGLLARGFLEDAALHEVEELVVATQFHIRF